MHGSQNRELKLTIFSVVSWSFYIFPMLKSRYVPLNIAYIYFKVEIIIASVDIWILLFISLLPINDFDNNTIPYQQ